MGPLATRGPPRGRASLAGGDVALLNGPGDLHLELGVEQRDPADLLEIGVDGILRAAAGLRRGRALPVRLAATTGTHAVVVCRRLATRAAAQRRRRGSSSSSSSTSTTPAAVTRSISTVSTSGVSSTACSVSMTSSWVSCPFSRPKAITASKSTLRHTGRQRDVRDGREDLRATRRRTRLAASIPSSSMAIAESSLTALLPNSSLLCISSDQPRYQPVGSVAPGVRIVELVQPEPHLRRLRCSGLP